MKYIAFYLPQYHEIEENNEWWGKGFTDWVNVKKAEKYYKNHRQPRVPLDGYYDLSNCDSIRSQAKLAKKYGIDGFCFYHYWFNGKLLLEKPVQLLLDNKDIDINYCFSWANETWARTWDGKNSDVLIEQTYGGVEEWEEHFSYFLPFFKDDRYIKVDNKPMLLLYKAKDVPQLRDMILFWNKKAQENGFDGIHLVETLRDNNKCEEQTLFSAHVEFEPARTLASRSQFVVWTGRLRRYGVLLFDKLFKKKFLTNSIIDYSVIAKESLNIESPLGTYGGVFLGWDNSPRKKLLSTIITEPTSNEFEYYLERKQERTKKLNDEDNQFLFINAWNEWAEGTYLEPDTQVGYKYLEIFKKLKGI